MGITYTKKGNYYVPNIDFSKVLITKDVGMYGRMRKEYLKEHLPITHTQLLMSGELEAHLLEVNKQATEMIKRIMEDLKKVQKEPDKMKNQMEWVGYMNQLHHQAQEIVLKEIIYN